MGTTSLMEDVSQEIDANNSEREHKKEKNK